MKDLTTGVWPGAKRAGRVVDGFVETEGACHPAATSRRMFSHASSGATIRPAPRHRAHHQILGQPALQSQAGHAERPVLGN